MSDSVRQLKEKELNDLKTRYDEFVQVSQQDMQKKQGRVARNRSSSRRRMP